MKTQLKQTDAASQAMPSKMRASHQAPMGQILQQYKDKTVQAQAMEEEDDLLQGKFMTQRKGDESAASPNQTGLPDNLKSGIENLSGYSMDDVKVHYNSPKPAQLQALAYTQGTDIHVGSGQEKYLGHEAWHVAQQKQGRVQPTMQLQGVDVNDNAGLEMEADVMGAKATVQRMENTRGLKDSSSSDSVCQMGKSNLKPKGNLKKEREKKLDKKKVKKATVPMDTTTGKRMTKEMIWIQSNIQNLGSLHNRRTTAINGENSRRAEEEMEEIDDETVVPGREKRMRDDDEYIEPTNELKKYRPKWAPSRVRIIEDIIKSEGLPTKKDWVIDAHGYPGPIWSMHLDHIYPWASILGAMLAHNEANKAEKAEKTKKANIIPNIANPSLDTSTDDFTATDASLLYNHVPNLQILNPSTNSSKSNKETEQTLPNTGILKNVLDNVESQKLKIKAQAEVSKPLLPVGKELSELIFGINRNKMKEDVNEPTTITEECSKKMKKQIQEADNALIEEEQRVTQKDSYKEQPTTQLQGVDVNHNVGLEMEAKTVVQRVVPTKTGLPKPEYKLLHKYKAQGENKELTEGFERPDFQDGYRSDFAKDKLKKDSDVWVNDPYVWVNDAYGHPGPIWSMQLDHIISWDSFFRVMLDHNDKINQAAEIDQAAKYTEAEAKLYFHDKDNLQWLTSANNRKKSKNEIELITPEMLEKPEKRKIIEDEKLEDIKAQAEISKPLLPVGKELSELIFGINRNRIKNIQAPKSPKDITEESSTEMLNLIKEADTALFEKGKKRVTQDSSFVKIIRRKRERDEGNQSPSKKRRKTK